MSQSKPAYLIDRIRIKPSQIRTGTLIYEAMNSKEVILEVTSITARDFQENSIEFMAKVISLSSQEHIPPEVPTVVSYLITEYPYPNVYKVTKQ